MHLISQDTRNGGRVGKEGREEVRLGISYRTAFELVVYANRESYDYCHANES